MNLKALHHYLTTLSPSEEKYRNGYVYDGWKDMPAEPSGLGTAGKICQENNVMA